MKLRKIKHRNPVAKSMNETLDEKVHEKRMSRRAEKQKIQKEIELDKREYDIEAEQS